MIDWWFAIQTLKQMVGILGASPSTFEFFPNVHATFYLKCIVDLTNRYNSQSGLHPRDNYDSSVRYLKGSLNFAMGRTNWGNPRFKNNETHVASVLKSFFCNFKIHLQTWHISTTVFKATIVRRIDTGHVINQSSDNTVLWQHYH